jgi:hypothetical protein
MENKKGYQSFKQKSTRNVYCSKDKYSSHADAKKWITAALKNFNIQADDTMEYQYPLDTQPERATIWPR